MLVKKCVIKKEKHNCKPIVTIANVVFLNRLKCKHLKKTLRRYKNTTMILMSSKSCVPMQKGCMQSLKRNHFKYRTLASYLIARFVVLIQTV